MFASKYEWNKEGKGRNYYFKEIITPTVKNQDFSKIITDISSDFVKIYNEAYHSEQLGLLEISGVGYRKALEFLIKDYAILLHSDEEEEIKTKFLGRCINDYISNPNIKEVAKRAVWLGNDETHYVRKWAGKNLQDMKGLISLTVLWVEMEEKTKSIISEMP